MQPLVVFDALVPSDLQNQCLRLQKCRTQTHIDTKGMRQTSRMDLGTSFRLDALTSESSPALLCPQAFADWPVEWATYPDSNAVWQGDLETDVLCHWRGAEEEMLSNLHTVYASIKTERRGRQREKWCARTATLGGRRRSGCGWWCCKKRNKSSQSNLWQWLLQCH